MIGSIRQWLRAVPLRTVLVWNLITIFAVLIASSVSTISIHLLGVQDERFVFFFIVCIYFSAIGAAAFTVITRLLYGSASSTISRLVVLFALFTFVFVSVPANFVTFVTLVALSAFWFVEVRGGINKTRALTSSIITVFGVWSGLTYGLIWLFLTATITMWLITREASIKQRVVINRPNQSPA